MSKDIQVGDRFEIVARITSRAKSADGWIAEIEGSRGNLYWTDEDLLSGRRLPRAIRVGDRVHRVSSNGGDGAYEVLALADSNFKPSAWVRHQNDGGSRIEFLDNLTPIPGDEK